MNGTRGLGDDGLQFVIDDETMDRLRNAAEARDMEVELLMVKLLAAASEQVDALLGSEGLARSPRSLR